MLHCGHIGVECMVGGVWVGRGTTPHVKQYMELNKSGRVVVVEELGLVVEEHGCVTCNYKVAPLSGYTSRIVVVVVKPGFPDSGTTKSLRK